MASNQTRFPHLTGCMENMRATTAGKGMCFHRSAALVLDLPGSVLCIGTFRAATPAEQAREPMASKVPFLHCWVEHKNAVFAPSTIERRGNQLVPMDPAEYYAINGAKDVHKLSRQGLRLAAAGTGLSEHLKTGVPMKRGPLGDFLLKAMGIPFTVTANGTAIPEGVADIA